MGLPWVEHATYPPSNGLARPTNCPDDGCFLLSIWHKMYLNLIKGSIGGEKCSGLALALDTVLPHDHRASAGGILDRAWPLVPGKSHMTQELYHTEHGIL
jgi:hypothetical protein